MAFSRNSFHRAVLRSVPFFVVAVLPLVAAHCATYASTADDPGSDAFSPEPDPTGNVDSGSSTPKDSGTKGNDAAVDQDSGVGPSDAATADAADAFVSQQGACGVGQKEVGQFATWGGKVNVHKSTGGTWAVDNDCSSGSNVNTVTYCQKFWSNATAIIKLAAVTPDTKPFTQGGGSPPNCGGLAPLAGVDQFACCAPANP